MKTLITLVVGAILDWVSRFILRKQSEAEAQKKREEEIAKEGEIMELVTPDDEAEENAGSGEEEGGD